MKFIDEAKVQVSAGNGGRGLVSWRREKFVPKGGPDGGDGGNGGAVVFVATAGLNTLIDFSFSPIVKAQAGGAGGTNNCHGADGKDAERAVPVGTQVYFGERLVADLKSSGARWIAARGGQGGKGNSFFKSSVNQAPEYAQGGRSGDNHELKLVLKSVADVGLVGLPNAGKSTLISTISSAQPKVADYPFTTLKPNLGVVLASDCSRFVVADIPGLIPGAHTGRGLGIQFLRHIERTSVLAQLLDVSSDPTVLQYLAQDSDIDDQCLREATLSQFEAIDTELRMFSEALAKRSRLLVISKGDLEVNQRAYELCQKEFRSKGLETVLISSVGNIGLSTLIDMLDSMVAGQVQG